MAHPRTADDIYDDFDIVVGDEHTEPERAPGTPSRRIRMPHPGVRKVRRPHGWGHGSVFYQVARVERRPRKDGSIAEIRKPAFWRAVYRVSPGERKSKTFKTEREARAWLAAEQRIGGAPTRPPMTTGEWFDAWLAIVKADKRAMTHAAYAGSVRQVLRPMLGAIRLDRLAAEDVQAALDAGRKRGLSPRTLQLARLVTQRALKAAVRKKHITRSPIEAGALEVPEVRHRPNAQRKELRPVIELARRTGDELVVLAAKTGMRTNELLGVRWMDIDWNRARVHVEQQRGGGDPKTDSGERTIALHAEALAALRRLRPGRLGDRVFPVTEKTARGRLASACAAAGVEPVTFRDLRHAAESVWSQVVPERVQAAWMGHKPKGITLGVYADWGLEDTGEWMRKVEEWERAKFPPAPGERQ